MEAIIFIGIQAAGKSTFYQRRFFSTHVRLSLDLLKTRNRERILLRACLEAKQPFVIDNTNVTREARAGYISAAKSAGFTVTGYYFQSALQAAIERNSRRTGRAFIPLKGIAGTHKRLELPRYDEGFDRLCSVEIDAANEFIVKEWVEPKAGEDQR
jgi:predicted kinase